MKNRILILTVLLLSVLLTACFGRENPPTVHIVHNGQLYEVNTIDTAAYAELDESKLIDATVISFDVMPAKEGEINVHADSVQIYDMDDGFLVIIDGRQHAVVWN